jgi:hypothetical protein
MARTEKWFERISATTRVRITDKGKRVPWRRRGSGTVAQAASKALGHSITSVPNEDGGQGVCEDVVRPALGKVDCIGLSSVGGSYEHQHPTKGEPSYSPLHPERIGPDQSI